MSPRPSTLLGLVLCLGQTIHMQPGPPRVNLRGDLPKPSLRAEPGPVIPWGRPVTFVCRGPAGATICLLEKDGITIHHYQMSVTQEGSQRTEARFLFPEVSEDNAGSYRCFCLNPICFSERSEPLQLQVTEEDVSTPPSGPASWDYKVENSIRLGLVGVVLLILVAILVEAGLSQPRSPQGPQE